MKLFLLTLALFAIFMVDRVIAEPASAVADQVATDHVAVIKLDMMILPGTGSYLEQTLEHAPGKGAKAVVVLLDTPGGILDTTQSMVQAIFKSTVPVFIFVSPQGGTASSAGVFITLAGHVAAMAPGTSIGAATPIQGDGKDIGGDLRQKAINATISMAKSIADQRGRNASWAEDAVKNASSVTEQEALKLNVIDFVAVSVEELLKKSIGRKVMLAGTEAILPDFSQLPRVDYEMSVKDQTLNFLANPNVVALLWLLATTGLSLELYNPGLIVPGVVGVICLVLAMSVSSIIPVSQAAIALVVIGGILIALELFTGSLILGVGGVVAILFGAVYLIDPMAAPGIGISLELVLPAAALFSGLLLFVAVQGARVMRSPSKGQGNDGMVGLKGKALSVITPDKGKVSVRGEIWNAVSQTEIIQAGEEVTVASMNQGLLLNVRKS